MAWNEIKTDVGRIFRIFIPELQIQRFSVNSKFFAQLLSSGDLVFFSLFESLFGGLFGGLLGSDFGDFIDKPAD
jgi:hypothetical protein